MELKFSEIIEAAPDAIALMAGAAPSRLFHPAAERIDLKSIALAQAAARGTSNNSGDWWRAALRPEFARALADGVTGIIGRSYQAAALWLADVSTTTVPNFRPQPQPVFEAEIDLQEVGEMAEAPAAYLNTVAITTAPSMRLRSFVASLALTRQEAINNQLAGLARSITKAGASAAKIEARLMAEALEGNPVMSDGEPLFATANTANGLAGAVEILGTQGYELASVFAAPGKVFEIRKQLHEAGFKVRVHALPDLAANTFYALAAPSVAPTISVMRLAGSTTPVSVGPGRPHPGDRVQLVARADLGAFVAARPGIIKGVLQ